MDLWMDLSVVCVFLPNFVCISSQFCLYFFPNWFAFLPNFVCISSQFCLYFFPNWFAFLPIFVCISSQFEAAACQRCKPDGSFHSHWEEIQDHQIIKSQTLKLVSEEGISPTWCCFSGVLPLLLWGANDVKPNILHETKNMKLPDNQESCSKCSCVSS